MVMKYPNFNTIKKYEGEIQSDVILKLTVDCIEYIYDGDQIYYAKDATEEELVEFIESMQSKDLEKIKHFFENMPKILKDVDFKCNKCGYEEKITVEGLESFFV
jgi:DNA-directed RNA polymerase subunit M/transcription elongation factor TFIIS